MLLLSLSLSLLLTVFFGIAAKTDAAMKRTVSSSSCWWSNEAAMSVCFVSCPSRLCLCRQVFRMSSVSVWQKIWCQKHFWVRFRFLNFKDCSSAFHSFLSSFCNYVATRSSQISEAAREMRVLAAPHNTLTFCRLLLFPPCWHRERIAVVSHHIVVLEAVVLQDWS